MFNELSGCFHAVGNGTFFTSKIRGKEGSEFKWGYDCGSTSEKIINGIIDSSYIEFTDGDSIDMMVISHFDDDHVNGLIALLRKHTIKRLVLPYSDWTQSIREISIDGSHGVSPSTALFQLNPALWLFNNDLSNRVETIILVQGNGGPENPEEQTTPRKFPADHNEPLILTDNSDESNVPEQEKHINDAKDNVFFDLGRPVNSGGIKILKINHMQPIDALGGIFEFIFYNAEKTFKKLNLVYEKDEEIYAIKSRVKLSDAKEDIQKTIENINLHRCINSSIDVKWREKLKNCYQKHFGRTNKANNNISLCMYASPKIPPHGKCFIFDFPHNGYNIHSSGLIFTGDINLTLPVLDDFESHLGSERWMNCGLFQIPHHGSANCWEKGHTKKIKPAYFVQCASPTLKHPSQFVLDDLNGEKAIVYNASRQNPIHFSYLF
ncbi:hypothetical protein GKQ23_11020 [Erwinia sp. E602]|uniref:hypothetical protein n=1 Tax=Erwinia sp. E602 TaxID=2675378 RepID=UPI001BA689D6|nr:hypothetical protein [Erwinia sp. E602]QUG75486.1 hypothetical protein GKQ23_11020 [Erwinia sp. E602]